MTLEIVTSGSLRLIYDVEKGTFRVENEAGERLLDGARMGIRRLNRGWEAFTDAATGGSGRLDGDRLTVEHTFDSPRVALHAEIAPAPTGFTIKLAVENRGDTDISGIDFHALDAERRNGGFLMGSRGDHDYRFFRHGFLTWSMCGTYAGGDKVRPMLLRFIHDMTDNPETLPPPAAGHFIGEWFGAAADLRSGGCFLAGFVTADRQLAQVDFKSRDGYFHHLRAISRGEGKTAPPGGRLEAEELLIGFESAGDGPPGRACGRLFEAYADTLVARMKAVKWDTIPTGWCSWYIYFTDIDEEKILKNLDAAKALRKRLPIEYFQIDDGYQTAVGDWLEPAAKGFPNGMKWMAERIHEAGFKAGLWLAPFFAERRSLLFQRHRDWFIHKDAGRPRWAGFWPRPTMQLNNIYALDATHPGARAWIETLFRTVCRDWGYDYVKIDFIHNAAMNGVRRDRNSTRAEAFRLALEAVRRGAGDDRFVLGCGSPQMAAVGLVNGMRISGDTAPYWSDRISKVIGQESAPGVFAASRVGAHRYFTGGRLWLSDPDTLMARFDRTKLTRTEVLTHATMVALLGGILMLSDDMSRLSEESIELAQKLMPPIPASAAPLDMFEKPMPELMLHAPARDYAGGVVLGVFNWSGAEVERNVPLSLLGLDAGARYHAFELWSESPVEVADGEIRAGRIPAHGSRLIAVRPDTGAPMLVASTFHFTMGAVEVRSHEYSAGAKRLRVKIELPGQRSGTLYFHCPDDVKPKSCVINRTHQAAAVKVRRELYSLEVEMEDEAEALVQF